MAEEVPEPVAGDIVRRWFGPDGDVDAFLATLVEPVRAAGHTVETVARYDPISVWGGVYRYLLDHPATLFIVNTRSRTGPSRLVFSSVAAAIVRHRHSPVLVVPRGDADGEP